MEEVLTYEEYEDNLHNCTLIKPIITPADSMPQEFSLKEKKKRYEWLYFHPENPVNNYRNFKISVKIKEKDYELICENGQVTTQNELVAEYLRSNGYILINKTEVQSDVS